jgi:hypothetical protein
MARGGAKPGERRGGRVAGTLNKRTLLRKEITDAALAQGITPPEVMLNNMRYAYGLALAAKSQEKILEYRTLAQDWAEDCANYFFPKMASVEHSGADGGPIKTEDIGMTDLARRLAYVLTVGAKAATGED